MRMIAPVLLTGGILAAHAASADTLQEVTTRGIIMTIGGFDLDLTFAPDGNFSTVDGKLKGTWRIDGDKLCTTGEDKVESCSTYPADKTAGDKFDITTPAGFPIGIKIKS